MDAASNGVATLRAFAEQDRYHYITALDDNQWNPRKVREQGRAKRYYYGEATLRDCQLELEDSREKGYLVVVRAIRIDWDHRSEEHTSELQSLTNLVCRLLLEKKKKKKRE